jgi:type I restriction enzyme S subunit
MSSDEFDGWFLSPVFPTFRTDPTLLDVQYFEWYCRQSFVWEKLHRKSRGIGARRESVSPQQFLSLEIPLPPLDEQHRIVARIEALAARVNQALALRKQAVEETKIISLVSRNTIYQRMSSTIKPIRLDNIAEMRLGKMLSAASKVSATPLPYLRNANIQWDSLDLSNVYEMDFDDNEKLTFRLKKGDILVCEGGDIGKSAIWNNELSECYFQKALHRVRVNPKVTIPRYILHHIFWAAEQQHFQGIKTQTTIPHLTGVKLKAYNIYLPPLDEQRRIVAYLDSLQARVDALRRLQAESQRELEALLPSILDRAFKGEL